MQIDQGTCLFEVVLDVVYVDACRRALEEDMTGSFD
jgi:hypothetical protein